MKYYIYYLPNAVRNHSNGKILYGKIGYTNDYKRRILKERSGSLDITGHHCLEIVNGTRKEAEAIERIWQDNFILVDGGRSIAGRIQTDDEKQKRAIANTGKIRTQEARNNMSLASKGKPKAKIQCNRCNKLISINTITQHQNGKRCI